MTPPPLVLVAASSGGLAPLVAIASGLPPDFPASILVASHTAPLHLTRLPTILSAAGPLPALHARHGEPIEPSRIYFAPTDRHLLVDCRGRIRLGHGVREYGVRPAADALFRSAAAVCGPRCIAVVLSGTGRDGAEGICAIRAAHGATVIQEPADAQFPSMPRAVLEAFEPDVRAPAAEIAAVLQRLLRDRLGVSSLEAHRARRAESCASPPRSIRGLRLLVVEDNYLLASEMAGMLRELGASAVGPVPDVASGMRVLLRDPPRLDGALLDVDLKGEKVFTLASALRRRGIPFVFATGYGAAAFPPPWAAAPRLQKPFDTPTLRAALAQTLGMRKREPEPPLRHSADPWQSDLLRESRNLVMVSRALRKRGAEGSAATARGGPPAPAPPARRGTVARSRATVDESGEILSLSVRRRRRPRAPRSGPPRTTT